MKGRCHYASSLEYKLYNSSKAVIATKVAIVVLSLGLYIGDNHIYVI